MTDARVFSLDFPRAYGPLTASAGFRTLPEDFQVDEVLGFEPVGEGEHLYVQLRKRGDNTAWVAEQLAQFVGVTPGDVGYAGRKDRHAVTTQWFSIYLPRAPVIDWPAFNLPSVELLHVARHSHKLRPGDHEANQFVIRLRKVNTDNPKLMEEKLSRIAREGVPNYFGEQRFGRQGNNLPAAEELFHASMQQTSGSGRRKRNGNPRSAERGLLLSAARAYLFNQVLAARVEANYWQIPLSGEPDVVATGPLWGRGRSQGSAACAELEAAVLAPWFDWCNALEHQGLQQERRPLVLLPKDFRYQWQDGDLVLSFMLGAGQFATAVLRELAELHAPEPA